MKRNHLVNIDAALYELSHDHYIHPCIDYWGEYSLQFHIDRFCADIIQRVCNRWNLRVEFSYSDDLRRIYFDIYR